MLRLLSLSVLIGCSSVPEGNQVWFKEGGTPQERDRLLAAAEVQARQAFPDSPMPGAGVSSAGQKSGAALKQARQDIVLRYMTAQGWGLVPRGPAR